MNTETAIEVKPDLTSFMLDNGQLIDLHNLKDMTGHDNAFTLQLISMFLSTAPDAMQRAQQAFAAAQYDEVHATVHKYKSSLNIMGNPKLSALASTIEQACRKGEVDDSIQGQLDTLEVLTQQIMEELVKEQESLAE